MQRLISGRYQMTCTDEAVIVRRVRHGKAQLLASWRLEDVFGLVVSRLAEAMGDGAQMTEAQQHFERMAAEQLAVFEKEAQDGDS